MSEFYCAQCNAIATAYDSPAGVVFVRSCDHHEEAIYSREGVPPTPPPAPSTIMAAEISAGLSGGGSIVT